MGTANAKVTLGIAALVTALTAAGTFAAPA